MQDTEVVPAEAPVAEPTPEVIPEAAPDVVAEPAPESAAEAAEAPVDRNAERTKLAKSAKATKAEKAAKSTASRDGRIHFVSANEEISRFDITVAGERISPFWDENQEHLIWSVPEALADRFALHEHVVKGRIIREK
jgi:hypothetical protein